MIKVSVSVLSCDFAYLAEEIKLVTEAGSDYIHIDVMDGCFVPNITIGPVVVKSMRPHTSLLFDVHLMIKNVKEFIKPFADAGADIITFHIETVEDSKELISLIRSLGKRVGVSIKPTTPVEALSEVLPLVDLVLVMTVEPGFGGQLFLPSQIEKIKTIRDMIKNSSNQSIHVSVDGGINKESAKLVKEVGADILVAGAYIFSNGNKNYKQRIADLRY